MGAASYIGRVGGLAVALGVGTAIASGHGVARADDAAGHSPAGNTASTADPGPSSVKSAKKTQRPKTTRPKKPASNDAAAAADPTGTDTDVKAGDKPGDGPAPKADVQPNSAAKPKSKADRTVNPTTPKPASTAAVPATAVVQPAAGTPPVVSAPATPTAATAVPATTATTKVAVFSSATALAAQTATSPSVPAPTIAPQNPIAAAMKAVTNILNWAFNPAPANPTQPTLAWTALAFARREFDNLLTAFKLKPAVSTAGVTVNTAAVNPAPGFPTPGQQLSPSTSFVNWITGNFLPNNTFNRFGIWGTDVGTMWDNGIADDPSTPINEHQVLIAFGDTFSGPNMTGTWRSNVLLRSSDNNLADGISIPDGQLGNIFSGSPLSQANYANQIIQAGQLPFGWPAGVTLIPTAGISVPTPGTPYGATQYLNFMSVKQWGSPGQWTTNYSAIAYSTDNGQNWQVAPTSVRNNSIFGGNQNFQQAAYVRPGDGYVYSYGTPNGRGGAAYLSRVAEADILNTAKYQYYSGGTTGFFGIGAVKAGWYSDSSKATPVFGKDTGACGVAKAGNHVSEMSVQYNQALGKYVTLYADQFNNVVIRTADSPQGTWSAAKVLIPQQNGGIYAPMMQPWSPSTQGTGTDLYWNLSLWSDYDVMLMKTDLTKI